MVTKERTIDHIGTSTRSMKTTPSVMDQQSLRDNALKAKIQSLLERLHSESAERYFKWAIKTQRMLDSVKRSILYSLVYY